MAEQDGQPGDQRSELFAAPAGLALREGEPVRFRLNDHVSFRLGWFAGTDADGAAMVTGQRPADAPADWEPPTYRLAPRLLRGHTDAAADPVPPLVSMAEANARINEVCDERDSALGVLQVIAASWSAMPQQQREAVRAAAGELGGMLTSLVARFDELAGQAAAAGGG